jgi:hypothetical protein
VTDLFIMSCPHIWKLVDRRLTSGESSPQPPTALQTRLDEIGKTDDSTSGRVDSGMPPFDLRRRIAAEFLGTALLVATVVGSGIMAEDLTQDLALQLRCNTVPTGAILVALITVLGPISVSHFIQPCRSCSPKGDLDGMRRGLRPGPIGRRYRRHDGRASDVRVVAPAARRRSARTLYELVLCLGYSINH